MKQIVLAAILILVPVAAFTSVHMYQASTAEAAASLGDLSALTSIIADVQAKAASGNLVGAKDRITDFETAWDDAEAGMRPLNPDAWEKVDQAADSALHALRTAQPDAAKVTATLDALQKALADPVAKSAN